MSFNSVTVVRPYEQIVKQIQQAIREGDLQRGARLPTERELAETFGVSRSVVRESVKVLAAMGLVESRQGSGLYVRNNPIETVSRAFILSVAPNADSVEKLFEFRQGLEMESARLAAARRTDDHLTTLTDTLAEVEASLDPIDWDAFGEADSQFHQTIAEASGNPYLEVAIATARDMLQDVVKLLADSPGSMREALDHHRRILAALTDRNAALATETMAAHVGYTAEVVQLQIVPTTP